MYFLKVRFELNDGAFFVVDVLVEGANFIIALGRQFDSRIILKLKQDLVLFFTLVEFLVQEYFHRIVYGSLAKNLPLHRSAAEISAVNILITIGNVENILV